MSSVGGSGGSDSSRASEDAVRKAREEYRKKESDLIKKHQKEMQKVEEVNDRQRGELRTSQEKQIKALQKDTRDTITAKDHKYQQEVENLRSMHRRQLQQAVEESQQNQSQSSKSKKLEDNLQREQFDNRLKGLQEDHAVEIQKKTESFQSEINDLREKQQDSVSDNRNKLNLKHQDEVSRLIEERDKDKAQGQQKYDSYRRGAEAKIEGLKTQNFKDREKFSEGVINSIRRERITHEDNLKSVKEGYDEALEDYRDRFDKTNGLRSQQQEEFRKSMAETVDNRVMKKIGQLENEKEDLKLGQSLQQAELKRQSKKEVQNLRDDFNKNIEGYEMDRREALYLSNERNQKNIRAVTDKHNQVFTEAMKRNLNDKTAEHYRSQNAINDIQRDFGARVEQQKVSADMRVRGIYDSTEDSKAKLVEQQKEVIEVMRFNHAEELKALRKKLEDDNREVIDNLKNQMRNQEVNHTEKSSMMMQKYEKQISILNDQLNKERREHDDYVKRTVSQMQQEQKVQLEAQDNKFSERARQMQERHAEELKSESKRHQQKTDQLLSTMKKG